MNICILHDFVQSQCPGGADLTLKRLMETAPKQIEVSWLPVNDPLQWNHLSNLIIANTRSIGNVELEHLLEGKKYVKIHFDYRYVPPKIIRMARLLIYMSPRQKVDMLSSLPGYNSHVMPSLVDPNRFYPAERPGEGHLWVGGYSRQKGIRNLWEWAEKNKIHVDFYGYGTPRVYLEQSEYCHIKEVVPYEKVPELFRHYQTLIHLPKGPEAGSRVFIEAVLSSLEVMSNEFEGNLSFTDPYSPSRWKRRLREAPGRFWRAATEALQA